MAGYRLGRNWVGVLAAGAVGLSIGCQTQMGGMTLPSNDYLRQNPTYFQPAPNFKLPREAMAMEEAARKQYGPQNGGVPAPVP
ncbi:MAG: hypothetical protein NZM31_13880 [Gemmatales bacterium]|nr:hypothetical protein [Gemmatales bacterium]MDW8388085.1 hypothetical protein [Gemmatales bacterium]